ncbi:MAG: T9SS type A sorting domain-containing protein [Microscillaceae bacterium]|jgi:hypothetical protein|nr:T9SS type A sorting domain-containing protein [Microscillaceae bacterium]
MQLKTTILSCVLLIISSIGGYAQVKGFRLDVKPNQRIVCPGSNINAYYYNPASKQLIDRLKSGEKSKSTFEVTYVNFTPEAKDAFQLAVDIWESILVSPVKIRIRANWTALGPGTLGSASPFTYFRSGEFPKLFTWYPIALAEKLAERELNSSNEPDIVANFNSALSDWYFGVDGNPPSNKYDLVTVVLHEIGHGLGFADGFSVSNGLGIYNFGLPVAYDTFIETETGTALTNTQQFPNNSQALAIAQISPLLFNSPIMVEKNNGQKAILHSPPNFAAGSSTSHLDPGTYTGTINSLMLPALPQAFAQHDPGPIMRNMFADMGWVHTYIRPDTIRSTETVPSSVTIKAMIKSDSVLDANSVFLRYSLDSFKTTPVSLKMLPTSNLNEYTATIPNIASGNTYAYYVSAKDNTKREYFSPSQATQRGFYNYFFVGVDNTPPRITHTQPTTTLPILQDTLEITANITDIFGIKEATLEYSINNISQTAISLKDLGFGDYRAVIKFAAGTIKDGDVIRYRIVAKDKSNAQNTATNPAAGSYVVNVLGFGQVRNDYGNNFNNINAASADFFGNEFSILQVTGFSDGAIHTSHPYPDGSGIDNRSNYIYYLKYPIRVRAQDAWMGFDEVVLVEPGEPGSVFGEEEFYDYVIAEGSKDNGQTWRPLLNGYDSRALTVWLSRWNSSISGNNSTATGISSLYRTRYIDLKRTFATNDEVIIRFRLFADPAAHGWGWAIDNLQIQGTLTGIEELLAENQTIDIFPNPSAAFVSVRTGFKPSVKNVEISLTNSLGYEVLKQTFANDADNFNQKIDTAQLPKGLYILNLNVEGRKISKKIIVH